jgi:hypothetical protein
VLFTIFTIPSNDEYASGVCSEFFHSVVAAKLIPLTRPEKSAKQNIGGVKTGKVLIVSALHDLAKLHRLCRSCRQA